MDKSKIEKIKKLYRTTGLGQKEIADKLGLSRSPVGKVLTKAFKDKTLKKKHQKSFNSFELRVKSPTDSEGKRKIYKVIREITNADRRKNSDIPQNAKYKTQLPSGIEYFMTRARTQKAIDESDNYVRNILPIEISARQIGNTSGFQPGNRIAKQLKKVVKIKK
ncbi:hypothetical protein OAB50_00605 [Candidatus Pelagibacter sp.]|nr:hypothetical protein [Candidatus Pelagibacter sp.]